MEIVSTFYLDAKAIDIESRTEMRSQRMQRPMRSNIGTPAQCGALPTGTSSVLANNFARRARGLHAKLIYDRNEVDKHLHIMHLKFRLDFIRQAATCTQQHTRTRARTNKQFSLAR